MRKLKPALPWIALASAVVAAGLLVAGSYYRKARITDTGETRAIVEKALEELLAMKPASLDDPDFKVAFNEFARSEHVVSALLAGESGAMYFDTSLGGDISHLGDGTLTLAELGARGPNPTEGLPKDEFSLDQLGLLMTKFTIEAHDADHNDVFATVVRMVRNEAGESLGVIGVRYNRSPWVSAAPGALWILLIIGFALSFQIYWISVPAWTFLDARDRGEKAWVWAAFTLVGNVIALVAYLLARAPRPANGA